MVRRLLDESGDTQKIIISTGGIGTGKSAHEIMETGEQASISGANAVGIYTGFMLHGRAVPSLVATGIENTLVANASLPKTRAHPTTLYAWHKKRG